MPRAQPRASIRLRHATARIDQVPMLVVLVGERVFPEPVDQVLWRCRSTAVIGTLCRLRLALLQGPLRAMRARERSTAAAGSEWQPRARPGRVS